MQTPWNSRSSLMPVIMLGLVAWAIFHAIGAYLLNHDPRRPLVVLACMGVYLGFWGLMLSGRRSRLRRQSRTPSQTP